MVDAYQRDRGSRDVAAATWRSRCGREGRLGVVDFKLEGGGPGPPTEERVSPETVIRDAASAGLRLLPQETFLPYQYFLIFGLQK